MKYLGLSTTDEWGIYLKTIMLWVQAQLLYVLYTTEKRSKKYSEEEKKKRQKITKIISSIIRDII